MGYFTILVLVYLHCKSTDCVQIQFFNLLIQSTSSKFCYRRNLEKFVGNLSPDHILASLDTMPCHGRFQRDRVEHLEEINQIIFLNINLVIIESKTPSTYSVNDSINLVALSFPSFTLYYFIAYLTGHTVSRVTESDGVL